MDGNDWKPLENTGEYWNITGIEAWKTRDIWSLFSLFPLQFLTFVYICLHFLYFTAFWMDIARIFLRAVSDVNISTCLFLFIKDYRLSYAFCWPTDASDKPILFISLSIPCLSSTPLLLWYLYGNGIGNELGLGLQDWQKGLLNRRPLLIDSNMWFPACYAIPR